KVDRKALPAVTEEVLTGAGAGSGGVRGPRGEREGVLCGIFAEVLGVAGVGIDEDFFALGGDSIRSIQVVARARKAGLSLTTRDVFTHKTVAALAQLATERTQEAPESDVTLQLSVTPGAVPAATGGSPLPDAGGEPLVDLSADELADLEFDLSEELS
ncbi:hypothetical protein DY218_01855, partial [Streptomyces triticagri]